MGLVTLTGPAEEPVTLAEVKAHLRVDASDTSNDVDIASLAKTARERAELFCRRRFVAQQVMWAFDSFPGYMDPRIPVSRLQCPPGRRIGGLCWVIDLPLPPVLSIDAFQYIAGNGNGTLQDLEAGVGYTADLLSRPARIAPPFGKVWPVTRQVMNAVQVTLTVGYGGAADVPEGIKTLLKRCVLSWYENRGSENAEDLPEKVKDGLVSYRSLRL